MDFKKFAVAVNAQFNFMQDTLKENNCGFFADLKDGNELWDFYLSCFPEGTNPIFRIREEYNCNTCRHFIRNLGHFVLITKDLKVITIWDCDIEDELFSNIAAKMSFFLNNIVKLNFSAPFFVKDTQQRTFGCETNFDTVNPDLVFNHFWGTVNSSYRKPSLEINILKSELEGKFTVYKNGLEEIKVEALEIVKELLDSKDNILLRGASYKTQVDEFLADKIAYKTLTTEEKTLFVMSRLNNFHANLKNTLIGSLLIDLSKDTKKEEDTEEDIDEKIERAVNAYNEKADPVNYKRTNCVVTQQQVDKTIALLKEKGLDKALYRRHCTQQDFSDLLSHTIFYKRKTQENDDLSSLLTPLTKETKIDESNFKPISLSEFKKLLPKINNIELFMKNEYEPNLMSLTTCKDPDAPFLFKWNNPFAVSFNGNLAGSSSIKERVKNAGGKVDGEVRFSLAWKNEDDLDIHVIEKITRPSMSTISNEIMYNNRKSPLTGGVLDIDANAHQIVENPVENITWDKISDLLPGTYEVFIINFRTRQKTDQGFFVEIAIMGETSLYFNPVNVNTPILTLVKHSDNSFYIRDENKNLSKTTELKEKLLWGVPTNRFVRVSALIETPSKWESKNTEVDLLWLLDDCKNPEDVRTIFNEFIYPDLIKQYKKVFDALGEKLKVPYSDEQLSGLSFDHTSKKKLFVRTKGEISSPFAIDLNG